MFISVANLLQYLCAKNYQNIIQFHKVIAKIKGCNFFAPRCSLLHNALHHDDSPLNIYCGSTRLRGSTDPTLWMGVKECCFSPTFSCKNLVLLFSLLTLLQVRCILACNIAIRITWWLRLMPHTDRFDRTSLHCTPGCFAARRGKGGRKGAWLSNSFPIVVCVCVLTF